MTVDGRQPDSFNASMQSQPPSRTMTPNNTPMSDRGGQKCAPEYGVSDQDTFEVTWDGDYDPLSPRSMSVPRKWVLVMIVCTGTFCV